MFRRPHDTLLARFPQLSATTNLTIHSLTHHALAHTSYLTCELFANGTKVGVDVCLCLIFGTRTHVCMCDDTTKTCLYTHGIIIESYLPLDWVLGQAVVRGRERCGLRLFQRPQSTLSLKLANPLSPLSLPLCNNSGD